MQPTMGPAYGTPEYKAQVEQVKKIMHGCKAASPEEIERVMMWFIMDREYSRAAICQAEKEYKRELSKPPITSQEPTP